MLIIDPPFLSRECFEKVSHLAKFIGKTTPQCKHIICTGKLNIYLHRFLYGKFLLCFQGAVQEENIKDFFPGADRVVFQPTHERNLMNPFACFVDYETKTLNSE